VDVSTGATAVPFVIVGAVSGLVVNVRKSWATYRDFESAILKYGKMQYRSEERQICWTILKCTRTVIKDVQDG